MHGRPPAFGGADGRAYTVAPLVDDDPDATGRYGAGLLFVRWSADGARPEGHLETPLLAWGETPAEAEAGVSAMTLHEVKAHLDACVGGRGEGRRERGVP